MPIESHCVVERLENSVADGKALSPPQMHSVFPAFDYKVVNEEILEGAYLNAILTRPKIKAAETMNSNILRVKKCKLAV